MASQAHFLAMLSGAFSSVVIWGSSTYLPHRVVLWIKWVNSHRACHIVRAWLTLPPQQHCMSRGFMDDEGSKESKQWGGSLQPAQDLCRTPSLSPSCKSPVTWQVIFSPLGRIRTISSYSPLLTLLHSHCVLAFPQTQHTWAPAPPHRKAGTHTSYFLCQECISWDIPGADSFIPSGLCSNITFCLSLTLTPL